MINVGLTGGIASGKSLALTFFKELGAATLDADAIAHACLDICQEGYHRVVAAFGEGILQPDRSIDRGKLGALIFSDAKQRSRLNSLLHPLIIERLRESIRTCRSTAPDAIIIVDVPLLFECGIEHDFDAIIVVYAPPEVQRQRLISRNNLTVEAAEQRLAAQMPIDKKMRRADYLIDNTGTPEELRHQVTRVYEHLRQRASGASSAPKK
ncbi:MAG: dephospho-CoA kinase [Desulfobacterota bacterium]|nr:dephospho-CoA kinase [Thermodesulfobacteriota bacterium]